MSEHIMWRLKEQTPYTNVLDGELMKEAADEITRLREENARLREALKPFEEELRNQELEVPQVSDGDSLIHSYGLRLRDLQAARAALKGERG